MSYSIIDNSQLKGHINILANEDLSAYETYIRNMELDASKIEDWIQARISAKDGIYPHEVMRAAHALL